MYAAQTYLCLRSFSATGSRSSSWSPPASPPALLFFFVSFFLLPPCARQKRARNSKTNGHTPARYTCVLLHMNVMQKYKEKREPKTHSFRLRVVVLVEALHLRHHDLGNLICVIICGSELSALWELDVSTKIHCADTVGDLTPGKVIVGHLCGCLRSAGSRVLEVWKKSTRPSRALGDDTGGSSAAGCGLLAHSALGGCAALNPNSIGEPVLAGRA